MIKKNLVQITTDQKGNEVVMVRVDKTLKELIEEKPFSWWDVNYWHPKWVDLIEEFKSYDIEKEYLGQIIDSDDWLIATDHVRASKNEKEDDNLPVEYYSPAGLFFTGYNTSKVPHCTENAFKRMRRARPKQYDLLLGGFGMGPTGKSVVLWHEPSPTSIVGNIFILRINKYYNPFVLDVFFKSKYGQAQFNKYKTGVAFNSLSNDEIRFLSVPIFVKHINENIESEYKKMAVYHDNAMEGKKNDNEVEYIKNIELAEKMLKDLIIKTEAVIRGERDDVID